MRLEPAVDHNRLMGEDVVRPASATSQVCPTLAQYTSRDAVSQQMDATPMPLEVLAQKSHKWAHMQNKCYSKKRKTSFIDTGKQDHGDMSNQKSCNDKRVHLGTLEYVLHAVFTLLENIPCPRKQVREVPVLYHITSAITFVIRVPRVIGPIYHAQWALMRLVMRREKRNQRRFKRMRFPSFDDEEPALDYGDSVLDVEPLEVIQLDLDEEEESPISELLYGHRPLVTLLRSRARPTNSGRSISPSCPTFIVLGTLFSLTIPIQMFLHLFDKKSFLTVIW
ncbi:pre-mRNA-splicing factor 8 [Ceratobasidium sp. 428]|nr:pre-mRNA-splicing factor 8 [Ceratobasidium sp. 428]